MSTDKQNNKKLTINGIEKLKGNLLRDRYVIDRVDTYEYEYDIEATHDVVPHRFLIRLNRYPLTTNLYHIYAVWYHAIGGGKSSHSFSQPLNGLGDMNGWLSSLQPVLKKLDKS